MQADFEKLRIWRQKEVLYRYASVRKVCDPEERKKKNNPNLLWVNNQMVNN